MFICEVRALQLCSLLASGSPGARHQVGVLRDVINGGGEHLEGVVSLDAVSASCRGHLAGIEAGHLSLQSGDPFFLSHTLCCSSGYRHGIQHVVRSRS